jgi:hypothetical protein
MARHESDREDLMREATALVRRVELHVPGEPEPVVCGFRADGRLSIYFGTDPVYHFDASGRLRRAFAAGDLFRSQGTTLARLTRVRQPARTELRRHDLHPDELALFLRTAHARLGSLATALDRCGTRVLRCVPDPAGRILDDLRSTLASILQAQVRLAPRIK